MTYLITGSAGFIGFHVCRTLLSTGNLVIGVDDLNDYYDVSLKNARLDQLLNTPGFTFYKCDMADRASADLMLDKHSDIACIIHLAAQAGVRYSLINPYAYTHSNIEGQLVVLELARNLPQFRHLVYASSSSVYGSNESLPFKVSDRADHPVSLYAATKKANELMAHCYSHLYSIPTTGLRFFTVYGPWGRPDMAYFLFLKAILEDRPIKVFNGGDMRRDFTYIDDIVAGILAVARNVPTAPLPYKIYNIGNHRSEPILRFISVIEQAANKQAHIEFQPMQPGDVRDTFADVESLCQDVGFEPKVTIDQGIPNFVKWYRDFYKV